MKSRIILTALIVSFLLFPMSSVGAQDANSLPVVHVPYSIYDFETIEEKGGDVLTTFSIVNYGDVPVKITDVSATCACIDTEYEDKTIMRGEKAIVTVVYKPYGRPGGFRKSIDVTINSTMTIRLMIQGKVHSE